MCLKRALAILSAGLLSGCGVSFRYRMDLDGPSSEPQLRNRYCITRVSYCPWPLEEGVTESCYENMRAGMEKTLREVHPELFVPGGEPIAVAMRSVDAETDGVVPLVCLNGLVSLATLGIVPVAGGFSNDFVITVENRGKGEARKARLRAENCASMGIVPTALLYSYPEDADAQFSIVGKTGIGERDRQAEVLIAKAFGAAVIQQLLSCEESLSPGATEDKPLVSPLQVRGKAVSEKEGGESVSVIEIEQIPL